MSRHYTVEEARRHVLDHIHGMVQYWATLPDQTAYERCEGLAFSILVMFDGCAAGVPAMDIVLAPHPDDAAYHIEHGERWYQRGMMINDCHLHELFVEQRHTVQP